MTKGYEGPKEEISNPILSIISQLTSGVRNEIEKLRDINKGKVGLPPIPDILQIYPSPESNSESNS